MMRLTKEQQSIVEANMRLVPWAVSRPQWQHIVRLYPSRDDAASQATIGLCQAAIRWHRLGCTFGHYASLWMFRELTDGIRKKVRDHNRYGQSEHTSRGFALESAVDCRGGANPADNEWHDDTVRNLLRVVGARQKQAAIAYLKTGSATEAAKMLGVSRTRVHELFRQIADKAKTLGVQI